MNLLLDYFTMHFTKNHLFLVIRFLYHHVNFLEIYFFRYIFIVINYLFNCYLIRFDQSEFHYQKIFTLKLDIFLQLYSLLNCHLHYRYYPYPLSFSCCNSINLWFNSSFAWGCNILQSLLYMTIG